MVEAITDFEHALKLKKDWEFLYKECPYITPFQSFAFFDSSWRFEQQKSLKLCIIAVYNDNTKQIVAILPTCIDTKGVLMFIGQAYSDFCSALVLPEYDTYSLYESISDFIKGYSAIRSIRLVNLQCNNPLLAAFKPFFPFIFLTEVNYYSKIQIVKNAADRDFVDSFKALNAKRKKNLRVVLKKSGVTDYRVLMHVQGDEYPYEDVNRLVCSMINSGIRTKDYFSDSFQRLWMDLYEREVLLIAIITDVYGVQSVNFMFYNEFCNEYIKWLMLYNDAKWNMILNLKLMDFLYTKGGTTVNFSRGIYDYKLVNFHPDVKPLFQIEIHKDKIVYKKKLLGEISGRLKQLVKLSIKS